MEEVGRAITGLKDNQERLRARVDLQNPHRLVALRRGRLSRENNGRGKIRRSMTSRRGSGILRFALE